MVEVAVGRRFPEGARDKPPGLADKLPEARLFTDFERVSLLAAVLVAGTVIHEYTIKV